MREIITILISVILSALVAKEIAAYQFKVVDSYVKDMIEVAKDEMQKAYINQGKP